MIFFYIFWISYMDIFKLIKGENKKREREKSKRVNLVYIN